MLLAGPLRWISNDLARRLRRYVNEGGLVASFGADTLRRGVAIARDRLLRPLPPSDTDPFGTRLRPVRTLDERRPAPADRGRGRHRPAHRRATSFPGITAVEESDPSRAGRVRVALAAVDPQAFERAETSDEPLPENFPALTLTRGGARTGDPRRAPAVGRQAPRGLGPGPAAHPQHRRHPARRAAEDPVVLMPVDVDTAAGPEVVRAIGIVLAAALAAGAMRRAHVAPGARWAMLGALALTPVLLVLAIWNAPQLDVVREHPAITLAGGALVALAIVIPLALLFARRQGVPAARGAGGAAVPRSRSRPAARPRTCSSRSTS